MVEKMKGKIQKITARNYISDGLVLSLINCFAVPKGEEDIRLVYDGTKSGLNEAVFSPNFFLPFPDSMLMWVDCNSWFGDLDLGEMFLNYFLDKGVRAFSGVDISKLMNKNLNNFKSIWKRWNRTFMGFTFSPYSSCKFFGWTVDIIYGDRWDSSNPYRWNKMSINFPGDPSYNPGQPRLCKMQGNAIAAMLVVFVDDVRTINSSELKCRSSTQRAAQIIQYLGQQNAARKFRPPHVIPGPWCGSFVAIYDECVWDIIRRIFVFTIKERKSVEEM
jgi:hypothetical protein